MAARRLLTGALLCFLLLLGSAPPTVGTTTTTTTGCVTGAELREVRYGMSKVRVHRIFGTRGTLVYLVVNNEEKRRYRMCDRVRTLTVTYLRGDLGYWRLRG
jgi:hypothetical protein